MTVARRLAVSLSSILLGAALIPASLAAVQTFTGTVSDAMCGAKQDVYKRQLLKRFVAADAGVGFIARSNVLEDMRANALVAIPISDATVRRDLALVFRKDKALSRAALAFIDIAVKIKGADAMASAKA